MSHDKKKILTASELFKAAEKARYDSFGFVSDPELVETAEKMILENELKEAAKELQEMLVRRGVSCTVGITNKDLIVYLKANPKKVEIPLSINGFDIVVQPTKNIKPA